MPQLDHTILFNQIFWLFFIFIILYFIFRYRFLPFLLTSFRVRKQILDTTFSTSNKIVHSVKHISMFYKNTSLSCTSLIKSTQPILAFLKKHLITGVSLNSSSVLSYTSTKILYDKFLNSSSLVIDTIYKKK